MQPRPPFDRTLWIPIAVGVVSILGIGWIFLTSDLRESFILPTATPTAIPFDDHSLETQISSFFPSETPTPKETPPTATGTGPAAFPGLPAETLPSTGTSITQILPTRSATPTADQIQPLPAGKYDDMDPNIAYDRDWTVLKNRGTAHAYRDTLHASTDIGSEASFRFTGKRFRLGYQRGRNFGTVMVLIDDQPYRFHEQDPKLMWDSPLLSTGDHFVRIIHESGETINLDYIVILD